MDFLSQHFSLTTYYYMSKFAFDIIGLDYYKGLKNKLPPIRYLGTDEFNNEIVSFAHPKDFNRHLHIFKTAYEKALTIEQNIKLSDIKSDILEIYPSTKDLLNIPNGFIGLFVNYVGMNMIIQEFNENDEVANINFLEVTNTGLDITNIKLCGVIETFIKKFNSKQQLIEKYNNLYLVIGEIKELNIINGTSRTTDRYNIIGGKRTYDENSIESTIRESTEEFGLDKSNSKIYKLINMLVPKTKDIIKCSSFNVYCIYINSLF